MSETTNIQAGETAETTQAAEPAKEKPYTLRKLEIYDVSPVASIFTQIGVGEFKDLLYSPDLMAFIGTLSGNEKAAAGGELKAGVYIALDIVGKIMANYGKCEKTLLKWLGSMTGMSEEEVGHMGIDLLPEILVDIAKSKEAKGFFSVVSTLFK